MVQWQNCWEDEARDDDSVNMAVGLLWIKGSALIGHLAHGFRHKRYIEHINRSAIQ